MKLGKLKNGDFYVAEYDKSQGKVVIRETSKNLESLAIKYGFISSEINTKEQI